MTTVININYNAIEFEPEQIKELELFISNQINEKERTMGTTLIFNNCLFQFSGLLYDVANSKKVYNFRQMTTQNKVSPITLNN